MFSRTIIPALMSVAVSVALAHGAAVAQTTAPSTADGSVQNVPQQIRDKLSSRGFQDVKVVPGSFLVSAKDKNGNPVMMIIGPDSMTMLSTSDDDDDSTADGKDRKPRQ
jgi:hypothetical protein